MDKRVEKIERDSDGFWIYLKPGFARIDGIERQHTIVEDTCRRALEKLRDVQPCCCKECKV